MPEITVEELARWQRAGEPFVLLDVRDADEVATVQIEGSLWIPMHEIVQRQSELDPASRIAVICHHGGRSERVAAFLSSRGFAQVFNVEGGIDTYAQRIEPSLARY
jgi:rhodanese-related sulfurtransferase